MLMWRTIWFGLAASVCAQFEQVNGGREGDTHMTNCPEEIAKTYQVGFCINLDFPKFASQNLINHIYVNDQVTEKYFQADFILITPF